MAKPEELDGTQRAAILLMSLGEQDAASLLKQLDAKDVQRLGMAMAAAFTTKRTASIAKGIPVDIENTKSTVTYEFRTDETEDVR